jgi:phosphatidylserine decarboxylase
VPLDEIFIHGRVIEEVIPSPRPWKSIVANSYFGKPKWFPLVSKRKGSKISGEVELQFSLFDSANPSATPEDILREFQALFSGTPTPSNEDDDALDREGAGYVDDEDDDENEEEISDETDDQTKPETAEKRRRKLRLKGLKKKKKASPYELSSNVVGVVFLEVSRITDLPPEHNSMGHPYLRVFKE